MNSSFALFVAGLLAGIALMILAILTPDAVQAVRRLRVEARRASLEAGYRKRRRKEYREGMRRFDESLKVGNASKRNRDLFS